MTKRLYENVPTVDLWVTDISFTPDVPRIQHYQAVTIREETATILRRGCGRTIYATPHRVFWTNKDEMVAYVVGYMQRQVAFHYSAALDIQGRLKRKEVVIETM